MENLIKENNFYSEMAMQKIGHVGLLGMAIYLMQKAECKDKKPVLIMTLVMVLLILDDITIIIHKIKQIKKRLK